MQQLVLERALLPEGWAEDVLVRFQDGVITEVAPRAGPAGGARRQRGVTLPGQINLHSHAFQRGMAGLAERAAGGEDSFWTWREVMYRFLDRLDPEDVEAIAALAYVEMVEAGFTTCVEFHYLHHAPSGTPYADIAEMAVRIAAAADMAGIGLTLLPVYYRWSNFAGAAPVPGQRRFLNDPDRFARLLEASAQALEPLPGTVLGVAPHSLRAMTPADLSHAVGLATDGPIHIHAAEQEREVIDCLAWSGRRPVEWLLDEMDIGPRWCIVHATHMTEDETRRLAESGAVAGLCPITEANLGDGIGPTTLYSRAGGRFGIGTDSNIRINAAGELCALEYSQRLAERRRNRLGEPGESVGRALIDATLAGGRQASGRVVGAIAPGCRADFLALDDTHPALDCREGDAVLDGWIFAAADSPVRDVWVSGVHVVRDGRHVARDVAVSGFKAALRRVLA
ncbi:MAG: formimidoylglutamate deiminase [Hyphomicrobiaceae bacterium]|nr:formimidoylglutamate deiminase [Hyphomicrobiaceae bacterium]